MSNDQVMSLIRAITGTKAPDPDHNFENIDAQLVWEGKQLILPAEPNHMSIPEAREWFNRYEIAESEEVAVHEVIEAFPWDGAVAFTKALRRIYGWSTPAPTPGFFGPSPPHMVSVDIGPNERTTVFWGGFMVPGIDGVLQTGHAHEEGRVVFRIGGKVRKKHLKAVHAIAELTRKIVAEESIYRGHALRLVTDDDGDLNHGEPPKFIDLTRVDAAEMVFSDELMEQVTTNLFTPVQQTARCRELRIPLKRGVLLEGPYGTGKTLCASVTAQKCEAHGWTFITVERVTALKGALRFAKMYQPCMVFVEDIDREVHGERTPAIDDILNTIDGLIAKGSEIMVVMTSNDAEAINRAMLRPGRLDAVLRIDAPDGPAAAKLMRIYGRDLIEVMDPLEEAQKELAGAIPAVIRECVERAKLYALSRSTGEEFRLIITDDDIVHAARGMKRHLELLAGKIETDPTPEHRLGEALGEIVNNHLGNGYAEGFAANFKGLTRTVDEIKEMLDD